MLSLTIVTLRAGVILAVASTLGCASVGGIPIAKTNYQLVIPASAKRYALDERQEFKLGRRIGAVTLPEYPASELRQRLPEQVVCVEIDIGEDGRVFNSRPMYTAPGCPTVDHHPNDAFYVAAQQAVQQWTFGPARICTFPEKVAANDDCKGLGVKIEYVPIRLAFLFSFTQERGPHVTSRAVN